ncbi:MAG: hypothetical protein LBM41_08205 [Ruminococcus sp.]|jgi:hypothetical protein|nr:hypothetical protein [Ruminococcus sp.]
MEINNNQNLSGETIFSFEQGYARISKAGVIAQVGEVGHDEIDLEIISLSEKFYSDTMEQLGDTFSNETTSEMQRAIDNGDWKSWWFAFLAGGSSSYQTGSDISSQRGGEVNFLSRKVFNFTTQNMEKYKQKFRINGSFDIVGKAYFPITVYLFIETLTIKTSDGQTIIIPTENVTAADANGQTGSATSSGKLNIIPMD